MADDLTASRSGALERLFERTRGRIEPGLERTQQLLDALGHPERRVPVFHVAGTNGKGSTCATLDALLTATGRRVGRFSSPHLVDFRERFLVAGRAITEDRVESLLATIEPEANRIGATFFEITTALAFAFFAAERVDVAVVETGMGGLLDSTNVVDPVVATVTNVTLDHTEYLGPTLWDIAEQKAGIFKPGRPAVVGEQRADLAGFLADRARRRGASSVTLVREGWRPWSVSFRGGHTSFMAETPLGQLQLSTPLVGRHQALNTLTALATIHAAGAAYKLPRSINAALATVHLAGRLQRVHDWIFDVAHNPAGARALAEALDELSPPAPLTALVAVLGDKDWYGILDALAAVVQRFIVTQAPSAPPGRAWDPDEAVQYAAGTRVPVQLEPNFARAIALARSAPGTKLVTGSFHTVGDAMQLLGIDPLAARRA